MSLLGRLLAAAAALTTDDRRRLARALSALDGDESTAPPATNEALYLEADDCDDDGADFYSDPDDPRRSHGRRAPEVSPYLEDRRWRSARR